MKYRTQVLFGLLMLSACTLLQRNQQEPTDSDQNFVGEEDHVEGEENANLSDEQEGNNFDDNAQSNDENDANDEEPKPQAAAPVPVVPPPSAPMPPLPSPVVAPKTANTAGNFCLAPAKLWWLGFDYQEKDSTVRVQVGTHGNPSYEILRRPGLQHSSEFVLRFPPLEVRRRLLRTIDTSEFNGPVQSIRTSANQGSGVEVVITLRENTPAKVYARAGNFLVSFPLAKNFQNSSLGGQKPIGQAAALYPAYGSSTLLRVGEPGKMPKSFPDVFLQFTDADLIKSMNATSDVRVLKTIEVNAVAADDFSKLGADEGGSDDSSFDDMKDDGKGSNGDLLDNSDSGTFDEPDKQDKKAAQASESKEEAKDQKKGDAPPDTSGLGLKDEAKKPRGLAGPETMGHEEAVRMERHHFQPLNLEFRGAPLRDVIRTFSKENAVNFILPETIGDKRIFLSLKNVPWDQALQAVLETHALGMIKLKGNVIRVDDLATLEQEKTKLIAVQESAARLIPTKVLVVRLSYAKAEEVVKTVTALLPSVAYDKRVKVQADQRTNSVIVEAIPDELSKVKAIIERVDLQTPQVKIAARIIEVLKEVDNQLGINWATPFKLDGARGLGFGNLVFPNALTSNFSVDTGINPGSLASRGAADFHIGSMNNGMELDLRLRLSETLQLTRTIQNNNIIVLDNQKAKIEAGNEEYFQVPVGLGQTQMSSVKYTLTLEVTPHITAEGSVQMEISIENASPETPRTGVVAANKNTRSLTTHLLRENGETAVIGGVNITSLEEAETGIPYFSKIPIVGLFFKSTHFKQNSRELLIMVTPTIVNSEKALAETTGQGIAATGN